MVNVDFWTTVPKTHTQEALDWCFELSGDGEGYIQRNDLNDKE